MAIIPAPGSCILKPTRGVGILGSNSDGITSLGPPLQGEAVLGPQPDATATKQDHGIIDWPEQPPAEFLSQPQTWIIQWSPCQSRVQNITLLDKCCTWRIWEFVVSGAARSGLYFLSTENIFDNKIQYGFMKYEYCRNASSIMILKWPQEKHCMHFIHA